MRSSRCCGRMADEMMNPTCQFCGASVQPRSRFCPVCGRQLPVRETPPGTPVQQPTEELQAAVEGMLPSKKRLVIRDDSLNLHEIVNVVESGVRWWQDQLTSADIATREQAAHSIEELSRILHSLSQQLSQGRETIRITTRLPVLRSYTVGCAKAGEQASQIASEVAQAQIQHNGAG